MNKKDGTETIVESLSIVCLTEELADVHFTFPEENTPIIPAHKMILSLRSPVFKAMFYGTYPQVEGDIWISDIKANTFKMMIRYIYTDTVDINGPSVISLLYAAQKYQLVPLLSKCERFFLKNLNSCNACTIYSQAKFFSMSQLQAHSLAFIAENANSIFGGENFLSFSSEDLIDILKLDSLCIVEIKIFQSVLKWTDRILTKSKTAITGKNRRDILLRGNLLYAIAIPLFALDDYTGIVLPSGVLTDEEQLHVFKMITVQDKMMVTEVSKFRMNPRKGNMILTIPMEKIIPSNMDSLQDFGGQKHPKMNRNGSVGQGEVVQLRPNSDIKVVSVNIKPRFDSYVDDHWEKPVTCIIGNKEFQEVYRRKDGLKFDVNYEIPSGQITTMNVSFGNVNNLLDSNHMVEAVPSNNSNNHGYGYGRGRGRGRGGLRFYNQQQNFLYSFSCSEDMTIDFEFSGVHLVDSIDVKRL